MTTTSQLRDPRGAICFPDKALEPVKDSVRRGLIEAELQGRLVVPAKLAAQVAMQARYGATRSGKDFLMAKAGGVGGLLIVGLVVGLMVSGDFF